MKETKEMKQKRRMKEIVKLAIEVIVEKGTNSRKASAPLEEIISIITEKQQRVSRQRFSKEEIIECIKKLERDGEIYQPEEDRYKMAETEGGRLRRIFEKSIETVTSSEEFKEWEVNAILDDRLKDLPEEWQKPERRERLKEIIREEIERCEAKQKNM